MVLSYRFEYVLKKFYKNFIQCETVKKIYYLNKLYQFIFAVRTFLVVNLREGYND